MSHSLTLYLQSCIPVHIHIHTNIYIGMQNKNISRMYPINSGYITCTFAPHPREELIKNPKQRKETYKIDDI